MPAEADVRPVSGAPFLGEPLAYDLGAAGYSNEEHFLTGTARSYTASPGEAPYRTRAIVRKPLDAARFNGTVVVEWLNVSGGVDAGPDWSFTHRHLMREGAAWVGVSAQRVGVEGGGFGAVSLPLKKVKPDRYGALEHPGDAFAFDVFSQAGRAVRSGALLGGATVRRLLAIGESQSAIFLVTYVNEVDPDAQVYDGFLIHGRGGIGAPLEGTFKIDRESLAAAARETAAPGSPMSGSQRIREDARVPVLTIQSETDVVGLGSAGARQPDGAHLRLWEIAGAAHADTYLLVASAQDDGSLSAERLATLLAPTDEAYGMKMGAPMNAGPQQHYVLQAGLAHLERWAGGGAPPPSAPHLELASRGGPRPQAGGGPRPRAGGGAPSPFVLDASGIARGGLRSPWVEAPSAVLSGLGQTGAEFAFLFGTTRPLDPAARARLYPGGRPDFLARFERTTDEALAAGFLLEADAEEILAISRFTPW